MNENHKTEESPQNNSLTAVSPGWKCDRAYMDEFSRRHRADFMVRWNETARNCSGKDPAWLRRLFRCWAIPTKRGGLPSLRMLPPQPASKGDAL